MKRFLLFMSLAVQATTPYAAERAVHETTLDNGLKVMVREDHRAPVAVFQIWYKVGSSYEYGGITGISHMLEHLMFKGTKNHPPGDFSRIIAAHGGKDNAFTSRDYTAYFEQMAAENLAISFSLEADRLEHLQLDEEEFLKERDVVAEERRMRTDDKPESLTYEAFLATSYQTSPYHHPVIGWMDDIQNYSLDDALGWFKRWYAPNNATIVVVGDVQPEQVFKLAQQYFGHLQPVTISQPKPQPEAEQLGQRRLSVKRKAGKPYVIMGYPVPSLATAASRDDAYALYMLAQVLDADDSSRLSRELIRGRELAASAGADYDLYARLSTLFTLDARPAGDGSAASMEAALLDEVARLQQDLVSQAELDRVLTQVKASKVYELDSMFYQAMRIGMTETVGLGWQVADELLERLSAVTPAQLRDVARRYLDADRLTVAYLEPEDDKEAGQ